MIRSLTLIFILSLALRLMFLGTMPPGVFDDEASQGYDAYSLLSTGKDVYGKIFPAFFRSFGTYASPLYTYLSVLPVKVFGLSPFSVRFVSAVFGSLLPVLTYLLFVRSNRKLAFVSSLAVALSPWSVLYSRAAFEANLALTLFVVGLALIRRHPRLSVFFLVLSCYAYQPMRFLSLIFLFYHKRWLHILAFLILLAPQLILLNRAGPNARLNDLSYFSWSFSFISEFTSRYLSYFSPKSLFFSPSPDITRSLPGLSVFYFWMVIPFFSGFGILKKYRYLFPLILFSSVPAAITKDPFAVFRALPLFWILTLVISYGIFLISHRLRKFYVPILTVLLIFISLAHLYNSYLVLLPFTRSREWGLGYKLLFSQIKNYPADKIVIDSTRGQSPHIFYLFYTVFPPVRFQNSYGPGILSDYYNSVNFSRIYTFDNVEIRPIFWEEDVYIDQILIGDSLTFSAKQVEEHCLTPVFTLYDKKGDLVFSAYRTHPDLKKAKILL